MQTWKKIGKALLFPHIAIMIILLPIAIVMTIYELAFAEEMTIRTYIAYALSAYTLTVWCFKIPWLIKFFKNFKNNNRYAVRWRDDVRLRVNLSLYELLPTLLIKGTSAITRAEAIIFLSKNVL